MQIKNTFKNIVAMTLAEVLITLTIMGVVFSLTVPTLKANADKKKMETLLQKSYTTVSNAIDMSLANDPEDSLTQWNFSNNEKMFDRLAKFINVQKVCSGGTEECFVKNYKFFSTGQYYNNAVSFMDEKSGIMAGDISFQFNECNGSSCHLHVDLNGPLEPNVIGYDYFEFVLHKDDTQALTGYSGCGTDFCRTAEIMENNWEIKYW